MGIFFRKSVRVGPFRFNLSGSGVGVSVGIPGLRIGTGPRGNYISAGRGGIYYRSALPSLHSSTPRRGTQPSPLPLAENPPVQPIDMTLGGFQQADKGGSLMLHDASSQDLLNELNEKTKRWRLAPLVSLISMASCIGAISVGLPPLITAAVAVLCVGFVIAAGLRDKVNKTSVLLYDLDQQMAAAYTEFNSAFERAAEAGRIWHVQSKAAVFDRKYHAGANTVIETEATYLVKTPAPRLQSNVVPPSMKLGSRTLYFFPDRILLHDHDGFGVMRYAAVQTELQRGTFVLGSESLPPGAHIVDYAWRYVNQSGGPDRRFANNPQIPNIAVADVCIGDGASLEGILKFSSITAAESLHDGITRFASFVRDLGSPKSTPPPSARLDRNVCIYCWVNDQVTGPFDYAALSDLQTEGKVTPDSLVCLEGETDWQFLEDLQKQAV